MVKVRSLSEYFQPSVIALDWAASAHGQCKVKPVFSTHLTRDGTSAPLV